MAAGRLRGVGDTLAIQGSASDRSSNLTKVLMYRLGPYFAMVFGLKHAIIYLASKLIG